MNNPRGRVVLINGTSSSGKSTLARTIQQSAADPFQLFSLDQFRDGMPDRFRGLNAKPGTTGAQGLNVVPVGSNGEVRTRIEFGGYGRLVLNAMRQAAVRAAELGLNVIVDDMIVERSAVLEYVDCFLPFASTCIGLRCQPDELTRREVQRPGRFPGTAVQHSEVVHAWMQYDVEIDTTKRRPRDYAAEVVQAIYDQQSPNAMTRMHRAFRSK